MDEARSSNTDIPAGECLVRRSVQTPPRAFEELVSEHLDALYRTALRLTGGRRADAEDLLQDSILRAFEHFNELRDTAAGRSWLFSILVRTNLNRARSAARRNEQLTADLNDGAFEDALAAWKPGITPEESFDRRESAERLAKALDRLDPVLRAAIVLTDVEGFSQREAALMLQIPEGTVASRLFRARAELRNGLRERPEGLKTRERA